MLGVSPTKRLGFRKSFLSNVENNGGRMLLNWFLIVSLNLIRNSSWRPK
jgi:hypothetical protein